jgi:hypothetical protein
MNFLHKDGAAVEQYGDLRYPQDSEEARDALIGLQKGFCAYSERHLKPLDSVEVEHFDPRKKNTPADGFNNWHAVIRWMNAHKFRRIALSLSSSPSRSGFTTPINRASRISPVWMCSLTLTFRVIARYPETIEGKARFAFWKCVIRHGWPALPEGAAHEEERTVRARTLA